jgi:hypothetical protein
MGFCFLVILKTNKNDIDIVDDAGVDVFGFSVINSVSFGGFSNSARFWNDFLKY